MNQATQTSKTKINYIRFNRRCDLIHETENVHAVFANCKVKELRNWLESHGGNTIRVMVKTHHMNDVERYLRSMDKRIGTLAGIYERTEWEPHIIKGYVMEDQHICTLTRIA